MKIITSRTSVDRNSFVLDIVKKRGMKQIGAGEYGSVFANKEEPIAIKVCHSHDQAYRKFVVEVLKHQTNPWFPRIQQAIEYHPKGDDPYFVVVMEKLRKGTKQELDGALCLFDNQRFKDVMAMIHLLGITNPDIITHLAEACGVLTRLYRKYGPDLHEGNIMFRKTQAVVIDPVVSD